MDILVGCLNYLKEQSPIIAFITVVGIIVAQQSNKHHISSIISELKNDYERVVFTIKDANIEIDKLVIELEEFEKLKKLNELKEISDDSLDKDISEILYDEKKYGKYQIVRLFYESLGCYVENNKKLFKPVFILFTFFDEFWRRNEIVIRTLRNLNWSISDYCSSSQKLYNRYKKQRIKERNKKKSFFTYLFNSGGTY